MKDFFMKHYNDSNNYEEQLKLMNIKERGKYLAKNASAGNLFTGKAVASLM